ncbi:hypothetical protein [Sphingomonas sp. IC4-52]|uniref:hypothetical protein n=1 Tax=Sphingomonas sp. IC4-52 TaxID=2887202 RepID=UPI001D1294A3|nr:hypothetical protein [Sphingomonas sp. IC4-52]MCC2980047.1 hypothetical protein [Sphingomonas sp. IC4-52]
MTYDHNTTDTAGHEPAVDETFPSLPPSTPKIGEDADASDPTTTDEPVPAAAVDATGGNEGGEGGKGELDQASPPLPPSTKPARQDASLPRLTRRGDDLYRPAPTTNPVVSALKLNELYRLDGGNGEHVISCPWASEHAAGDTRLAIYREPTFDAPLGEFACPCTHDAVRSIGAFLDQFGIDRMDARCKPRIRIKDGEPHRLVAAAEQVLADRGDVFRSNGVLVQVRIDRETGDVSSEQLSEQSLFMHLSSGSDWERFDGRKEDWRRCDVPPRIVSTLLRSQNSGVLPELSGFARQPFLRRDRSGLVEMPGYDAASGVYAAFDPAEFDLPEPTRENAMAALGRLDALLWEFEFEADTDRAGTLCMMLTAAIRDYLPLAPAFNITASSPGSGKSYLASVIAPFAGPGLPRNISYPATNEEAAKVVLSIALEKPAVVLFDDMNGDWLPHGAMNRMLTSGTVSERMLGTNRVVTAPASSLVIGTGNNIRPLRDMGRRVASIYLLPQTEAAAMRSFTGKPDEEVRRNRGRYVSDALTIVRAFEAAGRPMSDVPNVVGFEEWSVLCRHSLMWLGKPDPASSLIAQISHDPDAELLADLLRAWNATFGERSTMVRQVLSNVERNDNSDLHDAVMELPCVERGYVNQSKFGRYLARNKNRIVAGLQLVEAPHSERKAWAVKRIGKPLDKPEPRFFAEKPGPVIEQAWTTPIDFNVP